MRGGRIHHFNVHAPPARLGCRALDVPGVQEAAAGMAIFDVMQWIPNDVATVAMGMAASMGQFLLSAGEPGKRYATPHARVMMHQPSGGIGGTASDIKIQAEQLLHIKKQMAELIAQHTGQTVDLEKKYGIVDQVITKATMAGPGVDNPVTS